MASVSMDGVVDKRMKLNEQAVVVEDEEVVNDKDKGLEVKDKEHLINIFPEELWGMVLERVTDFKDRETLANSSTFFRDRLLEDRTTYLFPKVWELLAKHSLKEPEERERDEVTSSDEDYDRPWPRVTPVECGDCGKMRYTPSSFSWILNLRLVCKTWCNAVDNFYQNSLDCMFGSSGELDDRFLPQDDFSGETNETLIPFRRHFDKTHGGAPGKNPFISRTVTLELKNLGYMTAIEARQQAEVDMLVKYGHHIWHCNIDAFDRSPDKALYYNKLKQWLELMPNLKSLYVYSVMYKRFGKLNLTGVRKLVKADPLPKLNNLSCMIIADPVPAPIVTELIRSNGHVTRLNVEGAGENMNFEVYAFPLPNLEQVDVECFRESDFNMLEGPKVNWPVLKKLTLTFNDDSRCPFIKWDRVFSMLENKFKDSLTNINCQLPKAKKKPDKTWIGEQCHNLRLNLPKVTNFSTRVSNATCLDFLLPMKANLDYLQISIDSALEGKKWKKQNGLAIEKKQQIQIMGYTDRLLESNIWTLFPKLKLVDVFGCFGKPKSTAAIVKKSVEDSDDDEDEEVGDHFRYSRTEWYELRKSNKK